MKLSLVLAIASTAYALSDCEDGTTAGVPACAALAEPPQPTADIYNYWFAADAQISNLAALVENWSSQAGVMGALRVQRGFYPLSSAFVNLNYALDDGSPLDSAEAVTVLGEFGHHAAGLATLMRALADKAEDFTAVGIDTIARNDIASLSNIDAEVQAKVFAQLPPNVPCPVLSSYDAQMYHLSEAFLQACASFNMKPLTFPALPSVCATYC